jgi:hypothetical protein
MSYSPAWQNADAAGRVLAAEHFVRLTDAEELAAAINRRRVLTYQQAQDFSSDVFSGARVRRRTVDGAVAPPYDDFRRALAEKVLDPPTGTQGGTPPTPQAMTWLWPVADDEEDKTLVSGADGVGDGEVGLFQKLNGTTDWTDPALTPCVSPVRAVHLNELRQAAEWVRRGRWELPVYLAAGVFSVLPDTPWTGGQVANNGAEELRSLGYAVLRTEGEPPLGLTGVTVRASSVLQLVADADCTVGVHHCLREIDYEQHLPTWNEYDPEHSLTWSQPGGLGAGDSTPIDAVSLTAGVPGELSGAALADALQQMVDGAEQSFLFRRQDSGPETVEVGALLVVEFELDTPPN